MALGLPSISMRFTIHTSSEKVMVLGTSSLPLPNPYAFDRESRTDIPYKIDHDDLAYKLFTEAGFEWGGDWTSLKDYQHFEINLSL